MKKLMKIKITFSILIIFLTIFTSSVTKGQTPDPKLVAKHGLKISPYTETIKPAPEWLLKADMITMSGDVWKGHKMTIKDTVMTRIVRIRAGNGPLPITEHYPVETIESFDGSLVKGVSLISHVPHSKKGYEEAHKQGFKVIPYVHFSDIHTFYADQDVFMFQHPEVLMKDQNGKWVHIPMDGSDRAFRFLTCPNSPVYWKQNLAYVKKMMDWGADGIFIDNVGGKRKCYGTKFNVPEGSSATNPEFSPYLHEHLFPDTSESYAWDRMLQTIRELVKSYGDDKVVILNSGIGTPFQKNGDACMWESFIYSWAWEGRRQPWEEIKKRAKDNEWFIKDGRTLTALSFLNPQRKEIKDDAYWAFSAARLVDFIWWSDLGGTKADVLYRAHMGKGLEPLKETNGLAYRTFENGFIVLNDSDVDQNVELPLFANFKAKALYDLYNNNLPVKVKNKKVKVSVPKKTARVYVLTQTL